jgi:hypothetical protein
MLGAGIFTWESGLSLSVCRGGQRNRFITRGATTVMYAANTSSLIHRTSPLMRLSRSGEFPVCVAISFAVEQQPLHQAREEQSIKHLQVALPRIYKNKHGLSRFDPARPSTVQQWASSSS